MVGDLTNPQSLNSYVYALGDPVNLKDGSGYIAMPADCPEIDPDIQIYCVNRQNNFSKRNAAQNISSGGNNANLTMGDVLISALSSIGSAIEGQKVGKVISKTVFKRAVIPDGKGGIFPQIIVVVDEYPGLKAFYKYTGGVVSIGFLGYGIYDNYANYEYSAERTAVDMVVFGFGLLAGAAAAPAVATTFVTAGISIGGTYFKNKYYGRKKH